MASTRCPSCGLQNFATAVVCRHCNFPLLEAAGRPAHFSAMPAKKESFRWLRNAVLFSVALAILLLPVVFLFHVVLSAKHGASTGLMDFTEEQKATMFKWYGTSVGISVIVIFTIFYLRRDKQD